MTTTDAPIERLFHKIMPLAQFHLVKRAYEFVKAARANRDPYANAYDDYAAFATQAYRELSVETGVALLLAEDCHCTSAIPLALAFLYNELKEKSSTIAELQQSFGDEIANGVSRLTPPFADGYRYHSESNFYNELLAAPHNVRLVYCAYELYLYRGTLRREYRGGYPPYLLEKIEKGVLPIAHITHDYLITEITRMVEMLKAPPPLINYLP